MPDKLTVSSISANPPPEVGSDSLVTEHLRWTNRVALPRSVQIPTFESPFTRVSPTGSAASWEREKGWIVRSATEKDRPVTNSTQSARLPT